MKFSRDLDFQLDGQEQQTSFRSERACFVDTRYGFVLGHRNDPGLFSRTVLFSPCALPAAFIQKSDQKVFADKGYFGEKNRRVPEP